jgi:hypothetical protein
MIEINDKEKKKEVVGWARVEILSCSSGIQVKSDRILNPYIHVVFFFT